MRVFISFASRDREVVRQLEAQLRMRRPELSFFLDERALTGGVYWVPRLGEELSKADVVLLVLGDIIGSWQELEYYEALRLSRLSGRGRPRIIPVVIASGPAPGLAFLSTLHQIFALDLESAPALLAIESALGSISVTEVVEPWRRFQPYTGLPALTERDAAFFFGRDKETAEILALLAGPRRIVPLIGQSGSASRILSGSSDTGLRLWDATTGAQIDRAMEHEDRVWGAQFSQDGSRILSWTSLTLRLWDPATGAPIGPAIKHEDPIADALFSHDGSRILSWSHDGTIRLWDAATGAPIGPAMKHEDQLGGALVGGAQFSPDGSRILSWSSDTVRLGRGDGARHLARRRNMKAGSRAHSSARMAAVCCRGLLTHCGYGMRQRVRQSARR
ncbi:TIR domain-containing protein [Bradyrhizobium sp. AUGA SZCCT0240]|uniref:toll/interleukin-1 receptor domain-containing protein n=1 Tax=Bradyrhizobium sp. AUGA SZCCT0240 TaxID=2807669 RepID=UPI001BACBB3F|nr:TIR domain-containing protein [Bradyrhizobium sp. AUGA SZCCT0240]MBR1255184.1 TIR domain-containing protein [Bradyrhizobium sp. AUGA SZCCT0240]